MTHNLKRPCVVIITGLLLLANTAIHAQVNAKPLRLAVAGMNHGHVGWILGRAERGDIELVGVAEPDEALAERLLEQYNIDRGLWYKSIESMVDAVKPEAVCAFGSIYDHLKVVEICAPRGIHVMVEKPLAVNMEHAQKMKALAEQHHIYLLTNYETTWYPSNHQLYQWVNVDDSIGMIRKMEIHDGHEGPKEIGVSQEFLNWLTDPVQNGGGAIVDFGCYGANLATWLMHNQTPVSVTAVTRQFKPEIYPKVDDDATIIVNYPTAQAIIFASWNWPYGRKDIEVYGQNGQVLAPNNNNISIQMRGQQKKAEVLSPGIIPYHDPFAYFTAVVRGLEDPEGSLSSLANNMIVVKILDLARQSAKEGKTVLWNGAPGQ